MPAEGEQAAFFGCKFDGRTFGVLRHVLHLAECLGLGAYEFKRISDNIGRTVGFESVCKAICLVGEETEGGRCSGAVDGPASAEFNLHIVVGFVDGPCGCALCGSDAPDVIVGAVLEEKLHRYVKTCERAYIACGERYGAPGHVVIGHYGHTVGHDARAGSGVGVCHGSSGGCEGCGVEDGILLAVDVEADMLDLQRVAEGVKLGVGPGQRDCGAVVAGGGI